jgi:hypothetical protein
MSNGGNPNTVTITFTAGNPPTWDVNPDSLPVPQGPQQITWLLSNNSSPGTEFPNSGGIVFKQGSNWPGTTPEKQTATRYTASETNNNPGPGKQRFRYTINVLSNGAPFDHDPDVSNDPPTGGGGGDELPGEGTASPRP